MLDTEEELLDSLLTPIGKRNSTAIRLPRHGAVEYVEINPEQLEQASIRDAAQQEPRTASPPSVMFSMNLARLPPVGPGLRSRCMAGYNVPIVRGELLRLWHDYNGHRPSPEAKRIGRDGSLGQTIEVKAKSIADAGRKVELMKPGYRAITSAISRISR